VIDLPLKFRGKIKHANSIRENAPFSSLLHVNYRIFRFVREVMILVIVRYYKSFYTSTYVYVVSFSLNFSIRRMKMNLDLYYIYKASLYILRSTIVSWIRLFFSIEGSCI